MPPRVPAVDMLPIPATSSPVPVRLPLPDNCCVNDLQRIPAILPQLLQRVSPARTKLIIDHLQMMVGSDRHSDIVTVIDGRSAAIAVCQRSSDTATLLHAAPLQEFPPDQSAEIARQLAEQLDQQLRRRRIRFVQWATDPLTIPPRPTRLSQPLSPAEAESATGQHGYDLSSFAEALGFEQAGTLKYLATSLQEPWRQSLPDDPSPIHLRPLMDPTSARDADAVHPSAAFTELVERTYERTLDCPILCRHRSAEQTVASYRSVASFYPPWWYSVYRQKDHCTRAPCDPTSFDSATGGELVGCVIMARHCPEQPGSDSTEDDPLFENSVGGALAVGQSPAADESSEGESRLGSLQVMPRKSATPPDAVAELVYMGLLPEARGQGLGSRMLGEAMRIAEEAQARRFILAVDEANSPALAAYQHAGLRLVVRETVWVKSLAK